MKSWSAWTPSTALVSSAGICGSLMLAKWSFPSTESWWISVWKASLTCAAVPVNSMNIRLAGTLSTWKPCALEPAR